MIRPSLLICLLAATLFGQQSTLHKKDIVTIVEEANGAVVSIVMSDKEGHPVALGSGFLISKDGWIITNYHVIKRGTSAVIKFPDGRLFPIDGVLAADKDRDVAIIKAHGNDFRALTLGDSDLLQKGEEVVAIGSPLGLESTPSNGLFGGIRAIEKEGKFLQITAPISPGSSGGPLFNMAGEVVGITTLQFTEGQNLNFAIPINDVKPIRASVAANPRIFPNEAEDEKAKASPRFDQPSEEQTKRSVESSFVYPYSPACADNALTAPNPCRTERADPRTGVRAQIIRWQGLEVQHRRFYSAKSSSYNSIRILEKFTIVNDTEYPVALQTVGSTLGPDLQKAKTVTGKSVKAWEFTDDDFLNLPSSVPPHTAFSFWLHVRGLGAYRTYVKVSSKDFVFPGDLEW